MTETRKMTASELKEAYARGERDFRKIEVLREGLYRGANLEGANLEGANLSAANLIGANLIGANLIGANLSAANLEAANLYRANLYRANLYRANLSAANLSAANLEAANLEAANLEAANHALAVRVPGMSSRGAGVQFTATLYKDRLIVHAGCFEGTPDEFRAQVTRKHGDNTHAQLYLAQLTVFELAWKHWLTTLPQEEDSTKAGIEKVAEAE